MPILTSYRGLALALLAALPCLAVDCGGFCDGCRPPCAPERAGRLGLQTLSRTWLPATAPDSVRFLSSGGFRATLRRVMPLPADSLSLPAALTGNYPDSYRLEYAGNECGPYFRAERRRLRYQGRNLNLTITYDAVRDLNGYYPAYRVAQAPTPLTQAVADTLPDVVAVNFNNLVWANFPVVRRPYRQPFQGPQAGTVRYLDSVRVSGQLLRGVYQFEALNAPSTTLGVKRLYFQPGQGVVGFTYTNNEEWARY